MGTHICLALLVSSSRRGHLLLACRQRHADGASGRFARRSIATKRLSDGKCLLRRSDRALEVSCEFRRRRSQANTVMQLLIAGGGYSRVPLKWLQAVHAHASETCFLLI